MLSYWDNSVYCSPLADIISLDGPPPEERGRNAVHWGNIIDPAQDAVARLSEWALTCAVGSFLSTLSTRDQDVIRRVFWDGQRQADVARALGVSRMAITKIIQKVARLGRTQLSDFKSFSLN